MFRKPIVRKILWWASLVFLVFTGIAWIGSYIAAGVVNLPTDGLVHPTHVFDYYDGSSIYCMDGEICILPYTFFGSFKCDMTMDPNHRRNLKRHFFDDARREATWGMVFNFERGLFLFPLWIPLIAVGIPFAYFTRKSILRERLKSDGITYRWMPNRRSRPTCLILATVTFAAVLWISFEAGRNWLISNYGDDFLMTISQRYKTPDAILYGGALALWFVFSYTVARIAYGLFRRKRIPISENGSPLCLTCRFNLKGNTTGVCPECGTAIAKTAS
jgi:hypothetical protein